MTERADAAAALARAASLRAEVHRMSRWYAHYLLVYGIAAFVTTLLVGMLPGAAGVGVAMGLWAAVIGGLSVYAARQRVSRRGFARRHGGIIGVWAALYGVVLAVGATEYPGDLAWWLPGAALVALPALAGAYPEARR